MDQCTLQQIACEAGAGRRPGISFRFAQILRNRNFRLLWTGESVSLLGNQFFLVALPWLVLQLTGDAFAIGIVVAVTTAPRALFMLLGGALTDRFSPRAIMLYSNISRMALIVMLAVLTATGVIELWMLYVFGLLQGLGYAFYLPAQSAMIPRLLPPDRLQAGNAVIQGTAQLSLFLGPAVTGGLIALLGNAEAGESVVPDALGVGIVFGLTGASFVASAVTLGMIRLPAMLRDVSGYSGVLGVLRSTGAGIADVWRDKTLRYYFILIGVVNLCLLGPVSVGVPVLADTRFNGGALAFGTILSALGAGALVGVIAAGALRRPPGRAFAVALLGSCALLGVGLALLGVLSSWGPAAAAAFLIGLAEGYLTVEFVTWLQLRTPPDELGRMMGILLFVAVGQAPLSNLAAGALIRLSVSVVLIGAGGLIILVAVIAALSSSVWRLGVEG